MFAEALRAGQRAFNEGDYEMAFAAVAPDVEWHFGPWVIDGGVLHSREEVIRFYRTMQEAGAWHVEALDFLDAGDGRVIVHQRGSWAGRTTRIGAGRTPGPGIEFHRGQGQNLACGRTDSDPTLLRR